MILYSQTPRLKPYDLSRKGKSNRSQQGPDGLLRDQNGRGERTERSPTYAQKREREYGQKTKDHTENCPWFICVCRVENHKYKETSLIQMELQCWSYQMGK